MNTATVIELFRDLERGGRAVTSTRRLARHVEQRYADWKMNAGAGAWATPQIRVYDEWLRGVWQAGFEHLTGAPRLLSEDQELLLWEQVIRERAAAGGPQALLQLAGTARAARRTWSRIHEWQLDWQHMRAHRSADTAAFMEWAGAVGQVLADRNWLTQAQLVEYLVDHAAAWLPDQRGPVWWLGFEVTPPAARALTALLEEHGLAVKRFTGAGVEDAAARLVACSDAGDEWRRIARWARAELAADPGVRLGVVCPDLHRRREEIEDTLEDILHPELPWRRDAPRVYHLSLGRPLPEYPIVGSALDLLRWTGRRIPFDVVSRTLRSPYLGSGRDLAARIEFELALRKQGQESFAIAYLASRAGGRPGLADFTRLLGAAHSLDPSGRADPGGWSAFFSDWLRAFNWPGEVPFDSHEYQAINAWREQLSRFAGLNAVQDRWTLSDALKKLSAMASARILQFHDDQAPLQVMGASEAAGLWFDKLWLAGMSDAVWPPAAQPDPFIPVAMQKASGMPDASAQSVLGHARSRTDGLLASAPWIGISFAPETGDAPESLSPLFSHCRAGAPGGDGAYEGRIEQLSHSGPSLDAVEDQRGPPLPAGQLHGGVALVADQARCPFRAFAHHRLRARELEAVAPGLDPGTRGSIAHDALKRLWDRLRDRDALSRLDEAGLEALAGECAAAALEHRYADSEFQRRFLDIEGRRLAQLLREWLVLENQRAWFRVADTEADMQVDLGGGSFRVRVDRIDELADGRRLIIDYKTGQLAAVRDWADPRMEEPQLPMYALSIGQGVAALALARIRRGECELRGVADDVEGPPSLTPVSELGFADMAGLRAWWASALADLVAEFRDGAARVDPRTPRTCRDCDAMPLCRVFERGESAG